MDVIVSFPGFSYLLCILQSCSTEVRFENNKYIYNLGCKPNHVSTNSTTQHVFLRFFISNRSVLPKFTN